MTLRIAVLGCGRVARRHGARLRRMRQAVELSFASRDAARAEAYRRELGAAAAFGSYEAALGSTEIDAVLVATPPHLHLPLVEQALSAGKHVIVEKPPFLESSDFDRVAAAAAATRRQVLVAENYYYKPLAVRLRRLLREGVIGEPLAVSLNALKLQRSHDWRDDPRLAGGGALFEGGIHWVNLLNNLGLTTVRAAGFVRGGDPASERSAVVAVEYAEGAIGTLLHSWEAPSWLRGLRLSRIHGSRGTILFESNGLFLAVWGRRKLVAQPGLRDIGGWHAMFDDFLGALRDDREPAFTLAMARRDLEVIEAVYAGEARRLGVAPE